LQRLGATLEDSVCMCVHVYVCVNVCMYVC